MGQGLAQLDAAAVDAAADGAELDAEGRRDLLVRQTLDVAEDDGDAELRGERVERRLDLRVEVRVGVDLLGAGRGAGQPLGVLGQRVEADPLPAPDHVEEQVRGDPVQPALEGAGREVGQRAEDPDERLLGEVLGVLRVARQAVGQPVHPRGVVADDLLPGRRDPALGLGADDRFGHTYRIADAERSRPPPASSGRADASRFRRTPRSTDGRRARVPGRSRFPADSQAGGDPAPPDAAPGTPTTTLGR